MRRETGIRSATIARRLAELDSPNRVTRADLAGKNFGSVGSMLKYAEKVAASRRAERLRFDAKTVLVVDEAGMVGTHQMARLIEEEAA